MADIDLDDGHIGIVIDADGCGISTTCGCYSELTREEALNLYHALGDYLAQPAAP